MEESGAPQQSVSERERWLTEVELKKRELAIKEKELRQFWRNPLLLSIAGAMVVAFGHFYVAKTNGHDQLRVEEQKAEYSRILGALGTGDVNKAKANLKFLIDAGLVSNQHVIERINAFYQQNDQIDWPSKIIETPAGIVEYVDRIFKLSPDGRLVPF